MLCIFLKKRLQVSGDISLHFTSEIETNVVTQSLNVSHTYIKDNVYYVYIRAVSCINIKQ